MTNEKSTNKTWMLKCNNISTFLRSYPSCYNKKDSLERKLNLLSFFLVININEMHLIRITLLF